MTSHLMVPGPPVQPLPHICLLPAAILDDQSLCGRGERLALALARESVNSLMEASSRVEVDVYELKNDSQYTTTDTSESSTKIWLHWGGGCNSSLPQVRVRLLPQLSIMLVPITPNFLCQCVRFYQRAWSL